MTSKSHEFPVLEDSDPIGVLSERKDLKEYTKAYDEVIVRAQASVKEETA